MNTTTMSNPSSTPQRSFVRRLETRILNSAITKMTLAIDLYGNAWPSDGDPNDLYGICRPGQFSTLLLNHGYFSALSATEDEAYAAARILSTLPDQWDGLCAPDDEAEAIGLSVAITDLFDAVKRFEITGRRSLPPIRYLIALPWLRNDQHIEVAAISGRAAGVVLHPAGSPR